MSRIRIYELAKELGLENKAVLDLCDQLGIDNKKSHSNTLTDDEADKIRRSVIRHAVGGDEGMVREVHKEGTLLTERRLGNVIRRRKKSAEEMEAEAESAAAPHLDLSDVPQAQHDFPSLTPDLSSERMSREAALARANALFQPAPLQSTARAAELAPAAEPEPPIPTPQRELHLVETAPSVQEEPATALQLEQPVDTASVPADVREQVLEKTTNGTSPAVIAPSGGRRQELRGAKVLGKIELPQRPEPAKREAKGDIQPASGEAAEDEAGKSKRKKKETVAAPADDGMARRPRKKQILRKDDLVDYDGDRDSWRSRRDKKSKRGPEPRGAGLDAVVAKAGKKTVKIQGQISVGELAKQLGEKVGEVIRQLMNLGVMAGINQLIDYDTATLVAAEFGAETSNTEEDVEDVLRDLIAPSETAELLLRPPVVTVMGHVDHGKTSLLDAIRKTSVTAGEVGGITQHIGAYNVPVASGGSVTFLDTPGHEAFTAMRSRGAKVTDIVVLVVAADDGVMPQTVEALNHAKAAEVPILVAVNKMDKEGANPDRVKNQLAEHGLIPEEWGGDTIMVPVSAHTKQGIDLLLENLHVQAEVLELRADPSRAAFGTVVESKLDRGRGPVATVLVENGTLKKGDSFVAGSSYGRVRALISDDGRMVDAAGPSIPVEVLGASSAPLSGDDFVVVASESEARHLAEQRAGRVRIRDLAARGTGVGGALTLERFAAMVEAGEVKELALVVKGDVQGSVEAVTESLLRLATDEVKLKVIHRGVGAVSENDVQLAAASNAIVVAFNVRADTRASQIIEAEGVQVLYSRIIYDLVSQVESAIAGMAAPKLQEKTLGRVEVRQTFRVPKLGTVAGSYVVDGIVQRGALVRLLRDNRVLYEGKMASLRRFKDDVREVSAGYECGIGIEGYSDIQNGDIIEVYKVEEIRPTAH